MLINITSNSSKPIDINNGTVLLDRQRRFTLEAEENSVALISMQYDTGEYAIYIIDTEQVALWIVGDLLWSGQAFAPLIVPVLPHYSRIFAPTSGYSKTGLPSGAVVS